MKRITALVLCIAVFCAGLGALNTGYFEKKNAVRHWFRASMMYTGNGFSFAVPADWKDVSNTVPNTDAFFVSDGSFTMPVYDGSLQFLRSAIYAETLNNPDPSYEAKEFAKQIKSNKTYAASSVKASNVTLNDGTEAMLLDIRAEYLRSANVMIMKKIFFRAKTGVTKSVTGFINAAPGNDHYLLKTGALEFMESHVMSAVIDKAKLDKKRLLKAYKALPSRLNKAYNKCKKVMETGAYTRQESARIYEKTIRKYDYMYSVANALARIYLTDKDKGLHNTKRAMELMLKATEQTQRKDPDSLELLAIAYYRTGDKDRALMNLSDAIRINPFNARYNDTYNKMSKGEF